MSRTWQRHEMRVGMAGLLVGAAGIAMGSGCSRRGEADVPANGARCEARSYDAGSDTMQSLQIYDYDAAGRVVRAEWQYHELAFEKRGAIMTFEYDSKGRLITHTTDEDLDGKPDTIERFTYDDAGHLARKESSKPPAPANESGDFTYEGGRLARTEWHHGGALASFDTLTYSPDGAQVTTTSAYANGPVFRRTREDLDPSGHVVRVFDQLGGPALARVALERAYDFSGRLIEESTFDRAGEPESRTTYHYAQGILQSTDVANHGAIALHTTYSYRGAWKNGVICGELPQPK